MAIHPRHIHCTSPVHPRVLSRGIRWPIGIFHGRLRSASHSYRVSSSVQMELSIGVVLLEFRRMAAILFDTRACTRFCIVLGREAEGIELSSKIGFAVLIGNSSEGRKKCFCFSVCCCSMDERANEFSGFSQCKMLLRNPFLELLAFWEWQVDN